MNSPECTILIGDVRAKLREIPDNSVQCVVTSPPYWGLRDYGTDPQIWGGLPDCAHEWGAEGKIHRGGTPGKSDAMAGRDQSARAATGDIKTGCYCQKCGAWRGELGLEPTPELFVEHIVEVFREVKRVLRKDGTCWVNMGDCYAGGGRGPDTNSTLLGSRANQERSREALKKLGGRKEPHGLKTKDLVGQPWMVAFGLRADGWYLRQDIIWAKPNPMPESIRDRCTKAHEYIFLLTKSERYYYNAGAIKEPASPNTHARISQKNFANQTGGAKDYANGTNRNRSMRRALENLARSAGVNPKAQVSAPGSKQNASFAAAVALPVLERNCRSVWSIPSEPYPGAHYATFPTAIPRRCILASTKPGDVVLDPFGGSGTTGAVANALNRNAILIDLNPANEPLMRARLTRGLRIARPKKQRKCDSQLMLLEGVA